MTRASRGLRLLGQVRRQQAGQSIALFVVGFVALMGLSGLVMDVGYAYVQKQRLQASVDAAALAGAQKLPDATAARTDADTYVRRNFTAVSGDGVSTSATTGCQVAGCDHQDRLNVTATSTVPTTLLRVLGRDSFTVTASGSACSPCDSSPVSFDVVVVLDRSYSMCLDSSNNNNNCVDIKNAVDGIRTLIPFFSADKDRVGLVLLSGGDDTTPFDHYGSTVAPCDTANPNDANVSGKGRFYKTVGDFMDGTAASHDSWLVAPLASDFKLANGNLNESSRLLSTLTCVKPKYWTPIAPAIEAARTELVNRGRAEARKVIVFFGDGGGTAQPMKRDANGNATTTKSWYTPTTGNDGQPCHDAVGQAALAKAAGIEIYTIGYDLNSSTANQCRKNDNSSESGIDATQTLLQMASGSSHFYQKADPGQVYDIFNKIGHSITAGGTRLVE